MNLRDALRILSKSSPFAVTTTGKPADPIVREIKSYLHVETEIEKVFKAKLLAILPEEVVFLCGSSGDGKSEILARVKAEHEEHVDFHLDATHSFEPQKTAIEELDDLFFAQKQNKRPLVVGINTGMLANYQREGNDEHSELKQAIKNFERGESTTGRFRFLDFEAYPKFQIVDGDVRSDFFVSLIDCVVKDDQGNHFRSFYNRAVAEGKDLTLVSNFTLLSNRLVQKVIVELLMAARIAKDQFITARMLLDFIYCILTGPNTGGGTDYLFDNLFEGGDNELLQALADFDPSAKRTKEIDMFVLHRNLGFIDSDLNAFLEECQAKTFLMDTPSPRSLIRLFYLLQYIDLENNYHRNFSDAYANVASSEYKRIWELHQNFSGGLEQKRKLSNFYREVVFSAINKYSNRNAPYLTKDEFYVSSHGGCDLAAELNINPCFNSVELDPGNSLSTFNIYLKVGNRDIEPFPVSINLLDLMMKIVNGFRPNKHDKSCIVLLEELVTKIAEQASLSDVLYLHAKGQKIKLKHNQSDGEIMVSGL